jgi:cell division protein ZapA
MAESKREGRPAMQSISVDIYDQTYHLRGTNPEYLRQLATMVDSKMRAVAASGNTVDSLRVAVLAALNMADELARVDERLRLLEGKPTEESALRSRADQLSGLLDSVLMETRRAG